MMQATIGGKSGVQQIEFSSISVAKSIGVDGAGTARPPAVRRAGASGRRRLYRGPWSPVSNQGGVFMATTTPAVDLGWKAREFALEGVDGKTWRLADVRGPKGTLVMFICNHCPYVRGAVARIVRDVKELQAHGIGAIAIMPNDTAAYPEDSFDNMKAFARQHGFGFPYVIDRSQETARAYEAVCTPDFFGFNGALELQYRGRLDAGGKTEIPGAARELFEAMLLIARTGRGPETQRPSMGCSIKWRAN
jgi:peroxiredoxin